MIPARGLRLEELVTPGYTDFGVCRCGGRICLFRSHESGVLHMFLPTFSPRNIYPAFLVVFALAIERLYRVRHLRRGFHRPLSAIEFVRLLRLSLASPAYVDTS